MVKKNEMKELKEKVFRYLDSEISNARKYRTEGKASLALWDIERTDGAVALAYQFNLINEKEHTDFNHRVCDVMLGIGLDIQKEKRKAQAQIKKLKAELEQGPKGPSLSTGEQTWEEARKASRAR